MVILVTGSSGQVGFEAVRVLSAMGRVVASDRSHMDLGDPDSIRSRFRECSPAVVVNCAAFTSVDRAEMEPELAFRINAIAPGILAEEAARRGVPLVHVSTDYVFDGAQDTPYVETDPPRPLGVYGRSKLEGDRAIFAVGGPHVIVRTSWVYGARGTNFLRKILSKMEENGEVRVVHDQRGTPTWSPDLANALATIVTRILDPRASPDPSVWAGLYHVAGAEAASRFEFAEEIARWVRREDGVRPTVVPVSTTEIPTLAPRPSNSALACRKARDRFGISLPSWRISARRALQEYSP